QRRIALVAAGVPVVIGAETDDAGSPHGRRLTGDLLHHGAHQVHRPETPQPIHRFGASRSLPVTFVIIEAAGAAAMPWTTSQMGGFSYGVTGGTHVGVAGWIRMRLPVTVGGAETRAGRLTVALVLPVDASIASSRDVCAATGKVTRTSGPDGRSRNRPYTSLITAFQRTAPVGSFLSMTVPVAGVVATYTTSVAVISGV